jgi:uncharacterized membrane protein (UPF0127 family)
MKVEWARSAREKILGLMFRKEMKRPLVLELPAEMRVGASIHMMFVRFPIDAVFLDKHRRVVDVAKNLRPWTLNYTPKKAAKYVLEMKAGTAKYRVGDKVKLE